MDLKTVLQDIGLNEKEAAVYLATLELSEAKAAEVANRSRLNRVTCYNILEKLVERGFISTFTKKNLKIFTATNPKLIWNDVKERQENFESALPQLQNLYSRSSRPQIRYYEGLEGIKKIYADSLESKTEILNYADSRSIREFWPKYDDEYIKKRARKQIFLRGIVLDDDWGRKVAESNREFYRDIRIVKKSPFEFASEINIYNNKMSIVTFGKDKLTGVIIESNELAMTQRAIFMMAWEYAKMVSSS